MVGVRETRSSVSERGGVASVRVQCEAPPPIWLLDRAVNASQGQLKEFGAPNDWVLSCEKIVVVSDEDGTGYVTEIPVADALGYTYWEQAASFRYPRLRFTLNPANERRGQLPQEVELNLGDFAEFSVRRTSVAVGGLIQEERYSPRHLQLAALLPSTTVSPCGFTKADDPNSVSPFRVSFSAYSPRGAIACGVTIATQQGLGEVEKRLTCLENGEPCPPPSR